MGTSATERCFRLEHWMLLCQEGLAVRGATLVQVILNHVPELASTTPLHDFFNPICFNLQWSTFMVTDGGAMVLHCNHRTQATNGNDHCSWDIISVKSMKLSADDVKVYDEINVLDPGRRTIATT